LTIANCSLKKIVRSLLKLLLTRNFSYTKIAFALFGGLLMGLTPAPVEAFPLAWVALVPLWVLIVNATLRQATIYALAWGFGYHGFALFWITGIHPMMWLGVPWLGSIAIALFCWLFLTLWGALLVATWVAGMTILQSRSSEKSHSPLPTPHALNSPGIIAILLRVLMGVALWGVIESLWSSGPLWWTSLSYTQSPHNLFILQLTQLSGPATVTAAIVAVNGLIAEFILVQHGANNPPVSGLNLGQPALGFGTGAIAQKSTAQKANVLLLLAVGLLVSLHALGWAMYSRPLVNTNPIKVGIIQGNIPNDIKLFVDGFQRAMQRYTDGYERLADRGVDAVLTPEGALPIFLDRLKNTPFYTAVLDKKVVAWLGAYHKKPDETQRLSYTNSLFTLTGTREVFSRFDKVKLVPLGEYIPFEPILGKIVDRLSPLNAHLVAGDPAQVFDTPFGRAIVGICYESAFSEHFRRQTARGGEFILTASNNAHYAKTMPAQHHAQDVIRAIESDRWAARATNTGYSSLVDPRGRTIWLSGINTYEIHAGTIYRRQAQTLYVRWGDWLTWSLLGLGGLGCWRGRRDR
jgi:apolipoprotein N-acyltransferase